MVEAEPQVFVLSEQDPSVRLEGVRMCRAFETDKNGQTTIHVWIEANASPAGEGFETIESSIDFVFYNGDSRIGTCAAKDLKFANEDDVLEVVADDGLRIKTHEDVTHIEAAVESAIVTRSTSKLKLVRE